MSNHIAGQLIQVRQIRQIIRPRQKNSHKYTYGHALLYAGSPGMYGAGILCARACMKSGVGVVSILTEETHIGIYQVAIPEAICLTDWNRKDLFAKKTAAGVGPGLSNTPAYTHIIKQLAESSLPLVIDAAAFEAFSSSSFPVNAIITPHVGEFERLFGKSNTDNDRIQLAISKAHELQIYIVLKGPNTLITTPNGDYYFNSTGNPGMAKAGSGDVLAGILSGLLAQGYEPLHACLLGVYLHGLSGDIAAKKHTEYAMVASDIIDNMGQAWKFILKN